MDHRMILAIVFLIVGTAISVQAAPDPPSPPAVQERERMTEQEGPRSDASEGSRHFEAKRRERLIEMLQLDEATRTKLLQRLEQLDQKAENLRRERREAFMALREQAKGLRAGARKGDRKGVV